MIQVTDRVPTYPGRVKLIPVPGQENTFDMVRADNPVSEGTPINKALFDSISNDLSLLHQNVANIINAHSVASTIGSLVAGTEIAVYENNILVPYIKVTGDYDGTGRSAVMRKHIYKRDFLTDGSEGNRYANGTADRWLNNDYLGMLDNIVRAAITEVPVTCTVGAGDSSIEVINRKVFIASLTEYGIDDDSYNTEGTQFPYFNSIQRRKALFNGAPMFHWTRSPHYFYNGLTAYINGDGTYGSDGTSSLQAGIRPVFTLPHDFEVYMAGTSTANVMATAEVI